MSKYEERVEYIRSNFKYKKGEIFKRIKATTLAQLIIEVAEAMGEDDFDDADLDEAATFAGLSPHQPQPAIANQPKQLIPCGHRYTGQSYASPFHAWPKHT